jgi:hypothetical protein
MASMGIEIGQFLQYSWSVRSTIELCHPKDVPDEYDFVNEQEELINMCPFGWRNIQ